ncbi:MAG: hypothetical protein IJY20_02815 [Clostridia bacterium]|nr:hypothetical protein [Clostridia bacterium]
MTENYFEYAVDEKPKGKNLLRRVLLVVFYVVFALAYFIFFYSIKIPHVIAMLPFLLLIVVFFTWRYVNVTYEYIIAVGEITFSRILSNRSRKEMLQLSIRDLLEVVPDDGQKPASVDKIYDFRSEKGTPDSYCLVFQNGQEKRCLVYFEATKKALKLLQLYNPGAVKFGKTLRY